MPLLLLAGLLCYKLLSKRLRLRRWLAAGSLLLSLCCAGTLLSHHLLLPQRAVILQETPCYMSASYGAQQQTGIVLPGTTVRLLSSQDIWREISIDQQRYWVPYFTLRAL